MISVELMFKVSKQRQKDLYQEAEKVRMIKEARRGRSNERGFRLRFADWFGALSKNKAPVPQITAEVVGPSIWLV